MNKDMYKMIIFICGTIVSSFMGMFFFKAYNSSWVFPEDLCTIVLFILCALLVKFMVDKQREQVILEDDLKGHEHDRKMKRIMFLQIHQVNLDGRVKLNDAVDRLLAIVETGTEKRAKLAHAIVKFLAIQTEQSLEETRVLCEGRFEKIESSVQSIDTMLRAANIVTKLQRVTAEAEEIYGNIDAPEKPK